MLRCISQQRSTSVHGPGSAPQALLMAGSAFQTEISAANAACDTHRALRIAETHRGAAIMGTLATALAPGKALAKARSPSAQRAAASPAPPGPAAPRQPRLAPSAQTAPRRTAKPRATAATAASGPPALAHLKPGTIFPKDNLVAGVYAREFTERRLPRVLGPQFQQARSC